MDRSTISDAATDEEYLRDSVSILPEAIKEEFVRVPADMAFFGEKYAEAVKAFLLAENETKKLRAHLRLSIREMQAAQGKKMTEGDVDAWVEQDPQYQEAKVREIIAEADKLAARVKLDAVSAKKDMVQSLGAHIRQEMSPLQLNSRRDQGY